MTTMKQYEALLAMIRAVDETREYKTGEIIIQNPNTKITWGGMEDFYNAAASLIREYREQMDKQTIGGGRVSALKRIHKNCPASRPGTDGIFQQGEHWVLCDNYRAVRLNEKPLCVPEAPGIDHLDIERIYAEIPDNAETVPLPTVNTLKTYIAEHKHKQHGKRTVIDRYELIPGFWWCDPQFLMDILAVFPDAVAYMPENSIAPMKFTSADGDAILLPVRKKTEVE